MDDCVKVMMDDCMKVMMYLMKLPMHACVNSFRYFVLFFWLFHLFVFVPPPIVHLQCKSVFDMHFLFFHFTSGLVCKLQLIFAALL